MPRTQSRAAIGAACLLALTALGCEGRYTTVAAALPPAYQVLGRAEGTACGSHGLAIPPSYFFSVLLGSRVERAYQRALASVPGATALRNPTLQESWYWWLLMTTRCTTIRGDAVR